MPMIAFTPRSAGSSTRYGPPGRGSSRRRKARDGESSETSTTGAQQRLASLSCTLGLAQAQLAADSTAELQETLAQASRELSAAHSELRELARGIHPPVLVQGGIRMAVESLAEQSPVPVDVTVPAG